MRGLGLSFCAAQRAVATTATVVLLMAGVAGCTTPGAAPDAAPVLPTYAAPTSATPVAAGEAGSGASAGAASSSVTSSSATSSPAAQPTGQAPAGGGSSHNAGYPAEIVADEQVAVAAQVSGQVLEVLVDVGDEVRAGDLLVQLDSSALDAQRAQALASLEAAKSQLDLLQDPAKAQDLAAAQAAIDAAAAAYARAVNGPTDEERRLALAQLKSAEAAVTVAQAAYNRVKGDPNIGMMPQSLQLQQATLAIEAAQAQYDKLMKGATADQVAAANAQLASGRAAMQRLVDGARPAQIQAATAQMHAAESALYLATLQADKATIVAPMDGVVSKVQVVAGAMAGPAAPLLTLLSNGVRVNVQVEETLLPFLAQGQSALIQVDAYPDQTFAGVVATIAPELDATTRTVQVSITPDDANRMLRPGMSATVQLAVAKD